MAKGGDSYDLRSLLCTDGRDFLVRNTGDQVKVADLHGRIIGLYFSASWCGPCRYFTPRLIEAYNELSSKGNDFEVVFVSADKDEDSFSTYLSQMPWLAIPFLDSEARKRLDSLFKSRGIPHLVILDESGKVISKEAVTLVSNYGVEGYPFTPEKIKEIKEDEEAAKKAQTLQSVLASASRDYLIRNNGSQVPVSELEGKIVALYFSYSGYSSCVDFTPRVEEMYHKLKEGGEEFEVVLVSLDVEESTFLAEFTGMPWLAIPFDDKWREKLVRHFELKTLPTLVVLGPDGKTLNANVAELVEEHGVEAFPFSPEKLVELMEIERARSQPQTLQSLLVLGELDYVIGKDGIKVLISELAGKNVLLYFSAKWCGPCRAFLPKLVEIYHKIKDKDAAFEVVFISSDRGHNSFDEFYSEMPWLALPLGDERKKFLTRTFKIRGIPSLVAIGPTGQTVCTDARKHLMVHGADAYPFTDERIKQLDADFEEMVKGWPEKVKHELHQEHQLVKTQRGGYWCNRCTESGHGWSFYCAECDFDLDPKCALEEEKREGGKDGFACGGGVCRKV